MITLNTTIHEILTTRELAPYSRYLLFEPNESPIDQAIQRGAFWNSQNAANAMQANVTQEDQEEQIAKPMNLRQMTLRDTKQLGWSPLGVLQGILFFLERLEKYEVEQYFVYGRIECDEPLKRDVNIIRLKPDVLDETKPTVLMLGGGSYKSVTSIADSLPAAKHFVEEGYQVYIMTYRVGGKAALNAIEDLNKTIIYMSRHGDLLNFSPEKLILVGFDAGANVICNWGLPSIGYEAHRIPKPKALIPVYPLTDLKTELILHRGDGILKNMFGEEFVKRILDYNIVEHIDENYPPCYIVCGKNDEVFPSRNSELLASLLDQATVPEMLDLCANAPHGFGDGTGTDAMGWVKRACDFISLLM